MKLTYTNNQTKAIRHRNGNLLILACAGSGKTEVISKRIAELVSEGVKKSEIIAFTFTEKAAAELKTRIRNHLEEVIPNDPAIGDMYVGTIHSFCLHLLKEIEPDFRKFEVMDDARQAALIMRNFGTHDDVEERHRQGIGLDKLRHRTRTAGYWETVRTFVSTLNVAHQKQLNSERIADEEVSSAINNYKKIAHEYPNFFFDFNNIIDQLINFLNERSVSLENIRSRFKYIVVDEYQDIDDRQEDLIRLLSDSGERVWVTAVGDDDQAIYGWRGANVKNILTFTDRYRIDPQRDQIELTDNFRSTHAIVEIANNAISAINPENRVEKSMIARHWKSTKKGAELRETLAEQQDVQVRKFSSDEDEASWVAEQILNLRGTLIEEKDGSKRAIDYADFAILLRSVKAHGYEFAEALREHNIPCIVKGTGGLFDHMEVQLVQAAFCILSRSSFFRDGPTGIEVLDERDTREFVRELIAELRSLNAMPTADSSKFLQWLARKREELDLRNLEKNQRKRLSRRIYPQDIFQEILATLGSADGPDPWPQEILFNLGRLSNLITQFEAVHQWIGPNNLSSLCVFLGGWAAGDVDEGRLDEIGAPNAVQITTVHKAKGLEWPVVFIPRVSSYHFPSSRRNQGPSTFLDSSVFDASEYAGGDDGERRLWYVALTRCRKFLSITSPDRQRRRPTPYWKEIHHDFVQRDGSIEARKKGKPTPPAETEYLPTNFTALSSFWRCPFEYQLRSLMEFGPGVSESYGYGQQIHNVLAELHLRAIRNEYLSKEEAGDLLEERFHLRYTQDGETYKPLTELKKAARKSLERFLENYPDHQKFVLEAEKPFEFVDQDSGALISGSIDLLQRVEKIGDTEELTPVAVVDFKTHRWKDIERFSQVREFTEWQLQLYALAVQQALGKEADSAIAHFLAPRPPDPDIASEGVAEKITVDISTASQKAIRQKVADTVGEIRTSISDEKFEMRGCTTNQCPRCDFRQICPGFKSWRASDRKRPSPPSIEDEREAEMAFTMEDANAGQES